LPWGGGRARLNQGTRTRRGGGARGPRTSAGPALDSAPGEPRVSIVVDRYELGPIGTNCYVVRTARSADEAVVIDPSGDAGHLRLELPALGAKCAAILITHGHWDHLLGV